MLKEFKEFAVKGNLLDMAIGIMIGGAFGPVAGILVSEMVMPVVGLALGKVDFANMYIPLAGQAAGLALADAKKAGPVIAYGLFVNSIINFLVVAFVAFLIVRWANKLRTPPEPAPAPATKDCPFCASAISLKATRCPACTSDLR